MSEFLAGVCAQAHRRVAEARALVADAELRAVALHRDEPPSFVHALEARGTGVIAELKRASPSAGQLAWLPDPAARALAYERGGAAAISVLTEPAYFQGSLSDLSVVAEAVDIPVLRKDFVVDPYQVWEARAVGAAAVLLIVAALDDTALVGLLVEVGRAGLDALVEVHDPPEAARVRSAFVAANLPGRPVVGVNARDLRTLTVDPGRFAACVDALPEGALAVAESGVDGPEEVARAARAGADAVLVGTHLVRSDDPEAEVRRLVDAGIVSLPTRRRERL